MRWRRLREYEGEQGVNATPLIDVVMCLIVFFLMVGRLAERQRVEVRLPESALGAEERASERFVINVVGDGEVARFVVEDRELSAEEVAGALKARLDAGADVSVQIRADRGMAYGLIEPAMEACVEAGVKNVRLATEKTPGGNGGAR